MPQNLISLKLTPADLALLNNAADVIIHFFESRGISVEDADHGPLVTMGAKTEPFCQKAVAELQDASASLSSDFPLAELSQDWQDNTALVPFRVKWKKAVELVEENDSALRSDIMASCITGTTFLQALHKLTPNLDGSLKELTSLRRSKATKKPLPAA